MRHAYRPLWTRLAAAAVAIFFLATPLVCSARASGHGAAEEAGETGGQKQGHGGQKQGHGGHEEREQGHEGDSHASGELCALGAALAPTMYAPTRFSPRRAAPPASPLLSSTSPEVPKPVPIRARVAS